MEIDNGEEESSSTNNIQRQRGQFESDEHWEFRKEFLIAHRGKYTLNRLLSLSQTYCNIEILGCRYPPEVMQLIADLAADIGHSHRQRQEGQVQRHVVDASAAAEQKVKGRTGQGGPRQGFVHYGPPVTTKGPKVTYGPPVAANKGADGVGQPARYGGVRTYDLAANKK